MAGNLQVVYFLKAFKMTCFEAAYFALYLVYGSGLLHIIFFFNKVLKPGNFLIKP